MDFKNIKIKTVLNASLVVVSIILITVWVANQFMIQKIEKETYRLKERDLPQMLHFFRLKTDIIQIQQFLTDASATKNTGSINEAKQYYTDALQTLRTIERRLGTTDPLLVEKINILRKDLRQYFNIGVKMANAYITNGTEAGNAIMKNFDTITDRLAEEVEKMVANHNKMAKIEVNNVERHVVIQKILITLGNLLIFIVFMLSFYFIFQTLKLLPGINLFIQKLSRLDFTDSLNIKGKNEIATMASNLCDMVSELKSIVRKTQGIGSENLSLAENLSSASAQIGSKVEEESQLVNDVTSYSESVESTISSNMENAKTTRESISTAKEHLENVERKVDAYVQRMLETSERENELSSKLKSLASEAEAVKNVLTVISEIADQTNLLALNAAIEAARAGEAGRGFAVVADEVRKLAEKTQSSLSEIDSTISKIVHSITQTSSSIIENASNIGVLTQDAKDVQSLLNETMHQMNQATSMVEEMINNFMQNAENINEIVTRIEEINRASSENAKSVEEIASIASELKDKAQQMEALLSKFKLN